MRISFGCDHTARELKKELMALAAALGHICRDVGILDGETGDYPIFAVRAARLVQTGECDRGVVLCGTGIGVSLAANKMKGIRCALCADCYSAKMARAHNNANMLAMGARVTGAELAKMILEFFLETEFQGGRHERRVDMITRVEAGEPVE